MSTQPFLPFALPEIGEEEIQEVANCLRSGWLTTGPKTRQFETDFEVMLNTASGGVDAGKQPVQAIAVNSATAGLHLALEAIGIGPGDEVIVPSNTYIATWLAVSQCGATPVPVEPNEATFNIDPTLIEAAITSRTKLILPVHLYGHPADLDPILAIAKKHGLKVLEDAAQAHALMESSQHIGKIMLTVAGE